MVVAEDKLDQEQQSLLERSESFADSLPPTGRRTEQFYSQRQFIELERNFVEYLEGLDERNQKMALDLQASKLNDNYDVSIYTNEYRAQFLKNNTLSEIWRHAIHQ
jgi:hypothetical protein